MRKLFLKLGIGCALAFACVYAFGDFLAPLWQKCADPVRAQNSTRLYLLIGAAAFSGLYLIKKAATLLVLLVLVLLIFLLYYFDVFHWIHVFG